MSSEVIFRLITDCLWNVRCIVLCTWTPNSYGWLHKSPYSFSPDLRCHWGEMIAGGHFFHFPHCSIQQSIYIFINKSKCFHKSWPLTPFCPTWPHISNRYAIVPEPVLRGEVIQLPQVGVVLWCLQRQFCHHPVELKQPAFPPCLGHSGTKLWLFQLPQYHPPSAPRVVQQESKCDATAAGTLELCNENTASTYCRDV